MCMRPTTTVLATMKSEDFLYTCDGHLEDANFASKVKVTGEAIAEVKREWEERQVKQGKVKQGQVEQGKVKQVEQSQVKQGQVESQVNQVNQVESLQVKHEQYILHGDFFSSKYSLPRSCSQPQCAGQNTDDDARQRRQGCLECVCHECRVDR